MTRETTCARSKVLAAVLPCVLAFGPLPAQGSRPASTSRPATTSRPAPSEERSAEASALLEAASTLLHRGYKSEGEEREQAARDGLQKLRRVITDYADTRSAHPARFNAALALTDLLGKHEDAIEELLRLIGSDADDRENTGELMRPFRNYRFHAWRVIADCQAERGDLGRALVASCRARAAFVTHCGTCQQGMERGNLAQLQDLLTRLTPAADKEAVALLYAEHATPDALLLHLGRALEGSARPAAVTVLGALVAEFPDSAPAREARQRLAAPASRKK